jgi:hypothetical protein
MTGVHVTAERSGWHDDGLLGTGRANTHRPEERLYGDGDVVLEQRVIAFGEIEDLEVGIGESSDNSPKPGKTAVQP